MADASQKPQEEAPCLAVRIACWLGIIGAGVIPLVLRGDFDALTFPLMFIILLEAPLNLIPNLPLPAAAIPGLALGCGFYLCHLYAIARARTRVRFDRLLLILVVVTLVNVLIKWALGAMTI
ncbi:MAG: hypothetical protein LV481_05535 [Methylacidiphilales bacterium]|nr:hypothetical protein [Candidatus Methylacidiphilales bacterium]